ncbi:MAG: hypothetical protein K0M55_00795 [Rhizobium sp.]|nr:hypothetical protein [Rhizobium sp.]
MADFIAVIRRAVDGLSNNTPEMRAKVYDKARSAVLRQLENMNPRPPEQMLQRQLAKLDAAILEVEAEHAEALPDEEAAATFEEAMTPPPVVVQDWQEQAPEEAARAEIVPERPLETAPEAWEPEAAAVEPDPWVAPAEPEEAEQAEPEQAEPEDHAEAERRIEAEQVEPIPERAEVAPELQQEAEPEPAPEPEPQAEPVRWAEEPVETVEEQAPTAFPAYSDSDRDGVTTIEPEQAYAATAVSEEPEDYSESLRAAEAEAEIRVEEADTATVEAVPTVPSYNRLVEVPVTGEDDWMPRRTADAAADHDQATAPQPEAVQPAAYEPWELPADATWRSEAARPAGADALAAPSDAQSDGKAEPAAAELDWDSTAYALPSAGATDSPSRDMPVASDDFSDWFAEYDKPKAEAADEGVPALAQVGETAAQPQSAAVDVAAADAGPGAMGVEDVDAFLAESQQRAYRIEPKQRRNYAPVVLGLLGVALVAGGGFAAWTYRDQITQYVSGLTATTPATVTEQPAPGAGNGAETATGVPAPAAETAQPTTNGAPDDGSAVGQKFTQRLMPDGTEVDEGAGTTVAGGPASEGKSVSEQNVASTVDPTDQPAVGTNAGVAQPTAPTTAAPSTGDSVAPAANGERAFLYEERLGQTTPTAVPGTIAWSALRETGEDGKPNPEIQGKITIPDRGLTALITIKRNSDSSLPASHLIEVVFSVPPDFEGGAVDKLDRIAMKRTEQDRGDPLVAVAAKVTDDTYLVALNDFEDIMKANLDLLATRGWIDIPITYRNGRRALLTLDKGAAGAAVFDQVMKEWAALGGPGN